MIRQLVTLLTLALVALPAAAQSTRTTTFVYTDHLGSPIMLVEAGTRNVVWQAQYGPFGEVVAESGTPADRPGYTGHYRDLPTGLVYMQQRYYDPAAGRFLSTDPVHVLNDGGNFNRYWYANNNPYLYVDPDGEFVQLAPIAIGAAVGGGIGLAVEGARQLQSGSFDGSRLAAETGKGAVVGAFAVVGGAAGAAMAITGRAGAVGVAVAEAGGSAVGAGLGSLSSSPAADVLSGQELRPVEHYVIEAAGAAVGAAVGQAVGQAATQMLISAGSPAAAAVAFGKAAGEVAGTGVSESIQPRDHEVQSR